MNVHAPKQAVFGLRPRLLPRFVAMGVDELATHFRTRTPPVLTVESETEQCAQDWLDDMLAGHFHFIGETHRLDAPIDWARNPSTDVEWHILLHKFYHAVGLAMAFRDTGDARYLEAWQAQTLEWIEQIPADFIAADVTGRRIQNWLYALHLFLTSSGAKHISADFLVVLLNSIEHQVEWLRDHLHAKRNHRTLELFSILLTGAVLPELDAAHDWRRFALAELDRNAATDLLADGVHCELSSHYHCLVFKNLVNAVEIARWNAIPLSQSLLDALARMRDFAVALTKPDGSIPAIGDADIGDYRDLIERADRLVGRASMAQRLASFDNAGYHIIRSAAQDASCISRDDFYLIFDCGPLGEGNHGHLDCLSFEAAAYGRSLIVDPGRYVYHEDGDVNWRVRFRGTAAHNTMQIDGREQTRYTPGPRRFKITGAAPDIHLIAREATTHCVYLHGSARSHEYPVLHDRRIVAVDGRYWLIVDTLTADAEHEYTLRFQLSPEANGLVSTDKTPTGMFHVRSPNLDLLIATPADGALNIAKSYIAPRYGIKLDAPQVSLDVCGTDVRLISLLIPWKSEPPTVALDVESDAAIVTMLRGDRNMRERIHFGDLLSADTERLEVLT